MLAEDQAPPGVLPTSVRLLFVADVFGRPGLRILQELLPGLITDLRPDLVVANGENGADGRGMTLEIAESYRACGVDVITGGNHIFDKPALLRHLDRLPFLLRPLNFPPGVGGEGWTLVTGKNDVPVAVVSLQGRTYMAPIDCPFRTLEGELPRITAQTPVVFVDFHAEATAEKQALARYFDGRVSAVVGTHTHVQTADERVLPGGTGYITDAGMTGPFDSVIGNAAAAAIRRFLLQIPIRREVASADLRLNGVFLELDAAAPRSLTIERISLP